MVITDTEGTKIKHEDRERHQARKSEYANFHNTNATPLSSYQRKVPNYINFYKRKLYTEKMVLVVAVIGIYR